jgi:DNA repair exonuclease SbcCD ATPase subunit
MNATAENVAAIVREAAELAEKADSWRLRLEGAEERVRAAEVECARLREKDALQQHAIGALEMQLGAQGRELDEVRRQLKQAEDRLRFP